jgi:hypothetical protein
MRARRSRHGQRKQPNSLWYTDTDPNLHYCSIDQQNQWVTISGPGTFKLDAIIQGTQSLGTIANICIDPNATAVNGYRGHSQDIEAWGTFCLSKGAAHCR